MKRLLALCAFVLILVSTVHAHPMGNFSINQYSKIILSKGSIYVDYIVDFAEIPTLQMFAGNPDLNPFSQEWASRLNLEIDGKPYPLHVTDVQSQRTPGSGGLSTLRVAVRLQTPWQATDATLTFRPGNYADRLGWKEIVIVSDGSIGFPSGNPYETDRSNGLINYPADPLVDSSNMEHITVRVAPANGPSGGLGGAVLGAISSFMAPKPQNTQADRLGEVLQSSDLPLRLVLIGLIFAFSLGALHALSPGHGKTIVAAYLVGNRGTARHALFLGTVVTFTHTAGVFILGILTLFASKYIVPETLYPWVGLLSGLMIVAIGIGLFRQRLKASRGKQENGHDHGDELVHDHGDGSHSHSPGGPEHTHEIPDQLTLRMLFALGVSGGIIPCPSALVVLLSAVALHRIGLGLLLIVAFSVGLATVLVGIGMVVVRAQTYLAQFRTAGRFATVMPMASAVIITVIGLGVSAQSIGGLVPTTWLR